MKYLILLSTLLLIISSKNNTSENELANTETISNEISPKWLIGNWERIGDKKGKKTYEYWKENKNGEFIGLGCTLQGIDTIWKEDILLSKDKEGWSYNVTQLGDTNTTSFSVTQMDKKGFVCENKLNDFPKKISYTFDGKNINATISGGGPTITFKFKKME